MPELSRSVSVMPSLVITQRVKAKSRKDLRCFLVYLSEGSVLCRGWLVLQASLRARAL